jgi:phosphotransferase system  glucose/maltose/N-acetylglucosamine-specific IIC component
MPTALDIAFAVFFTVIITAFDTLYFVPKFKAAVNAGVPNARLHAYRRTVLGQWVFAAAAILLIVIAGSVAGFYAYRRQRAQQPAHQPAIEGRRRCEQAG